MTDTLRQLVGPRSDLAGALAEALHCARTKPGGHEVTSAIEGALDALGELQRAALGGSVPSPSPTQTGESPEFERGIASVLFLRCLTHRHVPQLNTTEFSGGECGACCADIALAVRASSPGPSADPHGGTMNADETKELLRVLERIATALEAIANTCDQESGRIGVEAITATARG